MVVAPKHTHRRVPDKLAAQLDTLKACCQDTERDNILIEAEATLPERPKKRGFKVGGARQLRREIPGDRTFVVATVGSCRVTVERSHCDGSGGDPARAARKERFQIGFVKRPSIDCRRKRVLCPL
jgi:hypothetical protein